MCCWHDNCGVARQCTVGTSWSWTIWNNTTLYCNAPVRSLVPADQSQCCCQRVASVSVRGGEAARDPGHCGDILVLVGDQAQGRPPSPTRCVIELETYLREVESFTITEKTHIRTFSWLKAKWLCNFKLSEGSFSALLCNSFQSTEIQGCPTGVRDYKARL